MEIMKGSRRLTKLALEDHRVQIEDLTKLLDSQLSQQGQIAGFLLGILFGGILTAALTAGMTWITSFNIFTQPIEQQVVSWIVAVSLVFVTLLAFRSSNNLTLGFRIGLMKDYLEARAIVLGRKLEEKTESPTASHREMPSKVESKSDVEKGNQPHRTHEAEDLDKEKVRMFWDYHRTRTYTSLTATISLFIGVIVMLNSILLAGRVSYSIIVFLMYVVAVLYFPYALITGVWVKNKMLVIQTDALMQKLAKHEPIASLKELLKVEEPATFWEEYRKLFGWSRRRIIAVTILILALVIWGFLASI